MTDDDINQGVTLAAGLCARFEGFRPAPYLCPARIPTIGYGTTRYADGTRVSMQDATITEPAARALMTNWLRTKVLPDVLRLCPAIDTPGRLGALLSFTYNLGAGNLEGSTLRKVVNAGEWAAVPAELAKWVRGGGQVLPGLVKRRAAEADLI